MSAFPVLCSLPKSLMELYEQQTKQCENDFMQYQRRFARHSHEIADRRISGMRNWNRILASESSLPTHIIPGNEARMKTPTALSEDSFPRKLIFEQSPTRRYNGSSISSTPGQENVLAGRHLIRYSMNIQGLHLKVECTMRGLDSGLSLC